MRTNCERGGALLTVLWFAAALGAMGFEQLFKGIGKLLQAVLLQALGQGFQVDA